MDKLKKFLSEKEKTLLGERKTMFFYMEKKMNGGSDLHAVADAAMDLREIEAKLSLINEIKNLRKVKK